MICVERARWLGTKKCVLYQHIVLARAPIASWARLTFPQHFDCVARVPEIDAEIAVVDPFILARTKGTPPPSQGCGVAALLGYRDNYHCIFVRATPSFGVFFSHVCVTLSFCWVAGFITDSHVQPFIPPTNPSILVSGLLSRYTLQPSALGSPKYSRNLGELALSPFSTRKKRHRKAHCWCDGDRTDVDTYRLAWTCVTQQADAVRKCVVHITSRLRSKMT